VIQIAERLEHADHERDRRARQGRELRRNELAAYRRMCHDGCSPNSKEALMPVAYIQEFAIGDRSTENYDFVAGKVGRDP
jgi:hypothetical protein